MDAIAANVGTVDLFGPSMADQMAETGDWGNWAVYVANNSSCLSVRSDVLRYIGSKHLWLIEAYIGGESSGHLR